MLPVECKQYANSHLETYVIDYSRDSLFDLVSPVARVTECGQGQLHVYVRTWPGRSWILLGL